MNKNEKATMEYRAINGRNPHTGEAQPRPLIVNKKSYDTARALRYAMETGKVTGTGFYANFGVVNGFLEAIQMLGYEGHDILLNGWLRIHPELTGALDPETRQLGPKNEVHVCVNAQKELRRKASDFFWTCVDETSEQPRVQHLQSEGGPNDREIFANAKITASGTHLNYTAASDKITAAWDETDAETGEVVHKTLTLTPEKSGYSNIVIAWPTGLTAPVGTEVTFQFLLKQGNAEASVIPATIKAVRVNAPNE